MFTPDAGSLVSVFSEEQWKGVHHHLRVLECRAITVQVVLASVRFDESLV